MYLVSSAAGVVSDKDCSTNDDCKDIDHAECDGGTTKCKCSDGYREEGDTCVKRKVSETDCTNGACTDIDNAECDSGTTKCKCSDGYKEDSTDGSSCAKAVSDTTCSENGDECGDIDNSHCDNGKCECDAGYVMNVDVCTAENAAAVIQLGALTVLLCVLATLIQQF
ncbi:25 kDa ookinete surface antigen-like [Ruditapes philippinarum]|uniref:25 kDa ookinete surface antigen-like n=1 Tax=Ruditapes philippinarum TaxID=129788 RepID=UPI00295B6729|nr:25 kDa ookinete surface antigen-like [Ruditapes philippinarum]